MDNIPRPRPKMIVREVERLGDFIPTTETFLGDQLHLCDALRLMRQVFMR